MYEFKLLDSYYDVDICLEYPDYRHTYYHYKEHIIARYNKEKEMYTFRLEERENILINQEQPTEVMDRLMIEIGNMLYPIELSVTPLGEIKEVINFDEIKKRWYPNAQKILDGQRTEHLKRYLQIASRNIKSELMLREALMRNTFVKLMLKPLTEKEFLFSFKDFPAKGGVVMYHCQRKQMYKDSGIATKYQAKLAHPADCEGDGYINYTFSELRDILEVDARFDLKDQEGQKWMKRITIKADNEERSASHKKSIWKRMIE